MSGTGREVKKSTKKVGIGLLIIAPIVIVMSVVFVWLKVPFWLNTFALVLIGLVGYFVFSLIYDKILKTKQAKIKEKLKKRDPFAD